jgi:hypothetical protein
MVFTGEALIQYNREGRLRDLTVLPTATKSTAQPAVPDWSRLFSEAGLNAADFTPSQSPWKPFYFADTQAAWDGSLAQAP